MAVEKLLAYISCLLEVDPPRFPGADPHDWDTSSSTATTKAGPVWQSLQIL